MDGRFNTIAGWVLGAGIVLLGAKLVTDELFHAEAVEQGGYPIAGVQEEGEGGGEAEQPIAFYLQTADAARGQAVFARCQTCHNADQGGANGLGPNLWGVMGEAIGAGHGGFAFSEPLKAKGGRWDWDSMSAWLRSPRAFAPGTKMTFAGLSNPQDRADVMLFLNQHGGSLAIPPPPAAAPAEGNAAEGNAVEANTAETNAAAPAANTAAPAH
ncbi:MAG TPA: cytochrome c family protein [Allosphingosinicella sp.]|nr:cytochrome c family protein [Allosphingosinicella sp.]